MDVYQALRGDRPYREGMQHDKAISIMLEMVAENKIDAKITEDIALVFKNI